jgi:hypothetical protein
MCAGCAPPRLQPRRLKPGTASTNSGIPGPWCRKRWRALGDTTPPDAAALGGPITWAAIRVTIEESADTAGVGRAVALALHWRWSLTPRYARTSTSLSSAGVGRHVSGPVPAPAAGRVQACMRREAPFGIAQQSPAHRDHRHPRVLQTAVLEVI